MDKLAERLKFYIDTHPIDLGDGDCETVLDQLYQAYAESHESDPKQFHNPHHQGQWGGYLCRISVAPLIYP